MKSFRKYLPYVAAALIGAATLAAPSQARAAFQIRFSTDGGATFSSGVSDGDVLDTNSNAGTIAINVDGFLITAVASGGTSSALSVIDLQIQQIGLGPATGGTVVVQASMDGLITVPAPQTLINRFTDNTLPVGGVPAGGDVATGETFVASGSGLFVTSGGSLVLDTGSVNPSPVATNYVFNSGTPYAITTQITSTFAAGASLQVDNNNRITGAPAPGGLLLAFTGLPVLSVGTWLRRRRNRVAA